MIGRRHVSFSKCNKVFSWAEVKADYLNFHHIMLQIEVNLPSITDRTGEINFTFNSRDFK
jgi:hypothetical protein